MFTGCFGFSHFAQVTDNVRDFGQTFVFGRSNAGEQVDEKAAMQIPTVYACVRLLAESIAALDRCIRHEQQGSVYDERGLLVF